MPDIEGPLLHHRREEESEENAADDRHDIKDRAGAGRNAENVTRVEHAHDGSGQ
jgi:hypothetical protein